MCSGACPHMPRAFGPSMCMLYQCRVDVVRRYELHALAAQQRRQLTPRLLMTGWTLLLLAQLAMLSAMHGRPRRRRYRRRRRRFHTTVAAAAEHPGVINLQALTSYGSPLPSLCR